MTGNMRGSLTKKHGPNPSQKINHILKKNSQTEPKNIWTTNVSGSVKKQSNMSQSNQNTDFWDQSISNKKIKNKFVVLDQQWKKISTHR